MKKVLLVTSLFTIMFTFGQSNNLSQNIVDNINLPASFGSILDTFEIFRFKPGAVTQLQQGSDFDFADTSRWFTLGQVTQGQTFYGSRFQYDGRALVQGFSNLAQNPRIQWIDSLTQSDLEFRVADCFTCGQSDLVATMTAEANTYFGDFSGIFNALIQPKVGIVASGDRGLSIRNSSNLSEIFGADVFVGSFNNNDIATGVAAAAEANELSRGVSGRATANEVAYGVFGEIGDATFGAAIYGDSQDQDALVTDKWAGYFNGTLFSTQTYQGSDRKLKDNIENETNVLERIAQLRPVTYTHKDIEGINLPNGNQHGFISQELAEVFPELTRDIRQPVLDDEGKVTSYLEFKAVNYVGLISVLTSGIQDLNNELTVVREELEALKQENGTTPFSQDQTEGYVLEQNVPNPFQDRSIIRYELAPGVESASVSIFNLNGGFIKSYPIENSQGQITVLGSDIGKGMFIYSLTKDGQPIISKKMVIQ